MKISGEIWTCNLCNCSMLSHLSSLLQYNYLTKINHLFLFAKIFFHRNSTTPSPIHYPSYAQSHAQCRNIGKSTPQAKTIFLCYSISISLCPDCSLLHFLSLIDHYYTPCHWLFSIVTARVCTNNRCNFGNEISESLSWKMCQINVLWNIVNLSPTTRERTSFIFPGFLET